MCDGGRHNEKRRFWATRHYCSEVAELSLRLPSRVLDLKLSVQLLLLCRQLHPNYFFLHYLIPKIPVHEVCCLLTPRLPTAIHSTPSGSPNTSSSSISSPQRCCKSLEATRIRIAKEIESIQKVFHD
ncbi:hypothetical protein B9Z55_026341 [Caenorhabditis nigoni]|uniref:Uncharacterized protein n=1 Tax=Caenorhabditis nigoni TaxID=1611254 RepID=A0A2G5T2V6_9PELO|nr:hypothetical protein B9Z55_026341 [Caenorhabditis nigoni]